MTQSLATLYYIYDPMCSWCWGFRPVWDQVQDELQDKVHIQYVLGGLAPDTDQPMPANMQISIRSNWQRIQREIPGTEFNYDFWTICQPRRSTYPACRAVIAGKMQQPLLEKGIILAIQQAYYLDAKNPSDDDVLLKLAGDTGLNTDTFVRDYKSSRCRNALEKELLLARKLHVSSFPALVLSQATADTALHIDYNNSDNIIKQIFKKLNLLPV
jgi:putative protein-disulfide isomerase